MNGFIIISVAEIAKPMALFAGVVVQYYQKTDRLNGTYFQAVHGETYDIEFIRAK